jgi:hypothetical protein
MPAHRAAVATALAGAALVSAAPLAMAADGPRNIVVIATTAKQGGTLTMTVEGSSCRGTGETFDAVVESDAFPRTRLTGLPNETFSVAHPRIFDAAEPGRHTVTATCGGRSVTGGHFSVVAGTGADAALGGMDRDDGLNRVQALLGGGLLAVSCAGIALHRRLARTRR